MKNWNNWPGFCIELFVGVTLTHDCSQFHPPFYEIADWTTFLPQPGYPMKVIFFKNEFWQRENLSSLCAFHLGYSHLNVRVNISQKPFDYSYWTTKPYFDCQTTPNNWILINYWSDGLINTWWGTPHSIHHRMFQFNSISQMERLHLARRIDIWLRFISPSIIKCYCRINSESKMDSETID